MVWFEVGKLDFPNTGETRFYQEFGKSVVKMVPVFLTMNKRYPSPRCLSCVTGLLIIVIIGR